MERLILDAGVLIALERDELDPALILPDEADVAVSAVTAAELLVGVELAGDAQRERRHETVEGVLERVETIPFDLSAARHHASLIAHARREGRPRGAHDLQVAATARASARTIVTTDGRAFVDLPGVEHRRL